MNTTRNTNPGEHLSLTPDEARIADDYNREYTGMSPDQAVAKAKSVLADIANCGKELPPVIVTKPVNHHLDMPKTTGRVGPEPEDAFRDGMMEALNGMGEE